MQVANASLSFSLERGSSKKPRVKSLINSKSGGRAAYGRDTVALGSRGPRTSLLGTSKDLSRLEAVAHLQKLRKHQDNGGTVSKDMLYGFNAVTKDNELKLHLDREYFTKALIPAIATAQDSLHIAMLRLGGNVFGTYITNLLIKKKKEQPHVAIRVVADDYGSSALMPWNRASRNLDRLRAAGIEVVKNSFFTNGLEHRKTVIVDGKRAFFGGACFGDKYFANRSYWRAYKEAKEKAPENFDPTRIFYPQSAPNTPEPFEVTSQMKLPQNHDFGIEVSGPAVNNFQANFIQVWMQHNRRFEPDLSIEDIEKKYFPRPIAQERPTKGVSMKVLHGSPKGISQMRQALFEMIESANDSLDIQFAYVLIPDFVTYLQRAAKRGVKINLIVPSKKGMDTKLCWYAFRKSYESLLKLENVRLFEYRTYTHCKFIISDGHFIFASTGNPEVNSWENGFDDIALIESPAFAKEVKKRVFDVDMTPERSCEVLAEDLAKTAWWEWILVYLSSFIIWLFQSPSEKEHPRVRLLVDRSHRGSNLNRQRDRDTGANAGVTLAEMERLERIKSRKKDVVLNPQLSR